ncbi:MAG: GAF domain-containing sensor histidine kinase, partial [Thermomicrobiaceae bacterium]|nr:GAF domain-containing sensor histidine kinase [Thermomicrobiaceae bacterium]
VYSQGERRRDIEGRPVPAGLSQIVARTREPMAVPDYVPACRANGVEPTPPFAGQERLAWMGAPMVQGGQTIGIISVFCPLLPFDRDDVELLAAIASQTAVAIENSRLLEAHRQRASQLKAIYQLARRIVTLREPDALLGTAVDLIHDLFGYATVSVFLTDPTCGDQVLRAHSNPAAEPDLLTLRIPAGGRGIVADVAASGQPAVVGDVRQDPRYLETPQTADTRSEMAVPIVLDDRILGVLDVQSPDLAAFDDHDLTTLRTIADQIAVALENARLFAEERERRKALELMLATTRAAGSSLVLDEVLERVARGIAEAAGSATCALYLLDEDGRSFIPAAAVAAPNAPLDAAHLATTPLRLDEATLLGRLVAAPETVLCCRRSALGIGDPALERLLGPACCALAVPLSVKGRTLGLALIPAEQSEEVFTPERVRLIQGVADSVALAIENARLYVRSQGLAIAEERGRLAQEIHDGLAQGLTAISLQLDLADAYLPANPERAAEKVRRALELTRQNLDEARRSVLDLRAAHLHQVALPEALRRLTQRFSDETGIQAELLTEGLSGRLAARLEIGLYRIAEEALTNVRLHAGATRVRIALTADQRQVQFRVQDDGAGFDPARAKREKGAGFGLVAIRERARLLRGALDITSAPGEGTTLTVTVPFEASVASRAGSEGIL